MASHVCVTVSGPALSFLIYENVKSYCDQEGFLLGEIISHVTDTISDAQIRGEKMETLISVNSLMPLPHSMSFYNGVGKVNPEKLKAFMENKAKEVIGWYSFRRNSSLVPHLRDRVLHKELCAAIPQVSPEHFTMCLLNTSVSSGGSTHMFNHKFMRYRHNKFEALPMQIHNLGETQPEYKLVPSTACLSESFNNIIASLKVGHDKGSDASLVVQIQKALQEHLWRLINDVAMSEVRVAELEKEVEMLRQQSVPLSNEILLPQLLREEVNNINKLDLSGTSQVSESSHTPAKSPRQLSAVDNACSNHISADVAEDGGSDTPASTEPFAYVTEMKIQMSQPRGLSSLADSSSNNNNNKRPSGRARGMGGRGASRGARKIQPHAQQKSDGSESFPSVATTSPGRVSPQANAKRLGGYAQAVKRTGNAVEVPKPFTRSQASSSQEY